MKSQDKTSIFDGISQDVGLDPEAIRPIYDRILVRDLGDEEKIGSIWIPETCRDKNVSLRLGIVVAIGPGDAWTEHGLDAQGDPRRRAVKQPCMLCDGKGTYQHEAEGQIPCPGCDGAGKIAFWFDVREYRRKPFRLPMICKPGDRIIYDRRREAEFYVDGQRLSLIHEEQSVFAVLEED